QRQAIWQRLKEGRHTRSYLTVFHGALAYYRWWLLPGGQGRGAASDYALWPQILVAEAARGLPAQSEAAFIPSRRAFIVSALGELASAGIEDPGGRGYVEIALEDRDSTVKALAERAQAEMRGIRD